MNSRRPQLVLASTSPFRSQLLQRLGMPFVTTAPNIDEAPLADEQPPDLVQRLSREKARAAAAGHANALIIGSDQVACIDGSIVGKPGNRKRAIVQLQQASGNQLTFYTGLSLLNSGSGRYQTICEPFLVQFRTLSLEQIERYVDAEQPFNCAGSFKSEGLGITLFERLQGDDPNALIGLPLIRLVNMLHNEGVSVP